MNDEELTGKKIAKLLNHSLNEIDQDTTEKLKAARKTALEKLGSSESIIHSGKNILERRGFYWLKNITLTFLSMIILFLIWNGYTSKINHENANSAITNGYIQTDDPIEDIFPDDE
ncbi:Protein of unknown function [Nitrosomonas marina]|uniref:Uncharacterized protein n=1 Tax=Nitrosomonas marina TaxID=917 RepID=A0A1I0CIP9_9PROT|nr:DUF3619 family protein [Nitrosomonas marina]SET19492.1 Protein of unknown function [Nitrosomonas marina]